MSTLQPRGQWPARLLCPWDSADKILEWVAMPSSRGSWRVLQGCNAGWFFTTEPGGKPWPHCNNCRRSSMCLIKWKKRKYTKYLNLKWKQIMYAFILYFQENNSIFNINVNVAISLQHSAISLGPAISLESCLSTHIPNTGAKQL